MRFTLRHLLIVIAVFAASLASGFPSALFLTEGIWEIVSIHEEEGDGSNWRAAHPAMSEQYGRQGTDYIATIRKRHLTQTINLGDTRDVSAHRLQLPDVGSYVVLANSSIDTHGTLPVASVEAPSGIRYLFAGFSALLFSVALVAGCLSIRWIVFRQAILYRERRMIDRSFAH